MRLITREKRQSAPLAVETLGDGGANTATCAGHQGDSACETEINAPSVLATINRSIPWVAMSKQG